MRTGYTKAWLAISLAGLPVAMATQIQSGPNWGPYQVGQGGEFTLSSVDLDISHYATVASGKNNGLNTQTFQTFCVEDTPPPEYIYPSTTYNVQVNTKAINGGIDPSAGGDPISKGTGWLYSQFATGNWAPGQSVAHPASFNYGTGRATDSGLLQNAIWWLEGEGGVQYTEANKFMKAVVEAFGSSQAAAQADGGWEYGVYALNLTVATTGLKAQDQLYYVPDGGATLSLLGLGLGTVALVMRRNRS